MGIVDKIKEKYPYLTRKQRDVANYMLEDVERMSYVTLKEVARDSGVTEMTVLKTCALLGFSSFSDLKYEFRKYAARQLEYTRHLDVEYNTPRIPGYELSNTEALLQDICLEEKKLTEVFFRQLRLGDMLLAADMILEAERIVLCGRGVSLIACDGLATMLSVVGRGVICVNTELDESIHRALPLLTPGTLVFGVSFPDYFRVTTKLLEYAHGKGLKVLSMTDTDRSPVCPFSDLVLYAPTQTRMFLNTMGAPMMLVNLLCSTVNIRLGVSRCSGLEEKTAFHQLLESSDAEQGGSAINL